MYIGELLIVTVKVEFSIVYCTLCPCLRKMLIRFWILDCGFRNKLKKNVETISDFGLRIADCRYSEE